MIVIKTKRGASRDGVRFNFRSEYGISDVNSADYGQPINHPIQLDETGTRFCVTGSGAAAACSRTFNWMQEMLRINGVNADTTRAQQNAQFASPGLGGGELLNVYQANQWPGQRYNTFAQLAKQNPVTLNLASTRFRARLTRSESPIPTASRTTSSVVEVLQQRARILGGPLHLQGK